MATKQLKTPKQIIKVLGGPTKTAEILNLGSRTVAHNWSSRTIPAKYYLKIKAILEPKGYELSPKAFGILEVLYNAIK